MKIVGIVQARMGATRLPNKMMLCLHGYPVVEWVFKRVSQASTLDALIFALPTTAADDLLADYLTGLGATVARGSETDVLSRFHSAANAAEATAVVRVCADNPLVSATEIDRLVGFYRQGGHRYAYNHIPKGNSYPNGLGAEIASMELLDGLHREATSTKHREHIFSYLWDQLEKGDHPPGTIDPSDKRLAHPELSLDLDTMDDYRRLLALDLYPEMSAIEIVNAALHIKHGTLNGTKFS
ncbi:cytidylyltransferase domain-containing protein [Thiorhodovibrio frisius]|uniref:Spore coat polysaccharide biosynthesis protein F, CMP-KDO synthetase n=1 Tax=Thiorhodovibrio frisius TaxID=631362 RepID=H8Z0A3_9GAMM|nr:NTP transferase domain-containing protein [Thiorhodovibrio frisius]EIC22311.1 spore coat polysaccharide biosynthesis protein F, CMP-KDO synthetase [Thiorhodovibrio frisius]WPL24608.1 3-deoxy-manno-octulosonate cytidylyltransferase [Thiorhodovibrio frisius]